MKSMMACVCSCAILALTGCATAPEAIWSAYERAQICCQSLAQLRYEKLPDEKLRSFDIDERSQMFLFDSGRSFALGVELPSLEPPFLVRIKSFALADDRMIGKIFYPLVLVLDSNHNPLSRQYPPPDMSPSDAGITETISENKWGLQIKYQWDLLVDDQAARYLVIYTHATIVEAAEDYRTKRFPLLASFVRGALGAHQTRRGIVAIPASAFGRISLQGISLQINAKGPASEWDKTALMEAVRAGQGNSVEILLAAGADVNASDSYGDTALMFAAETGRTATVRRLIAAGAQVNAKKLDGSTALMIAARQGHTEVVDVLLDAGADVNALAERGGSALTLSSWRGHFPIVKQLIDRGADVNVRDEFGRSALMSAAFHGRADVVRALIERRADVNARSKDDEYSALTFARARGHAEIVDLLRNAGAKE